MATEITRGGVTFNITDSDEGGLTEAQIASIIDNASRQPSVARMLDDLAASSDPDDKVVNITIDDPDKADNFGANVHPVTQVMDIDSRQMANGDLYKVAGTGNGNYPGDGAQIIADQIFVHELAHIHDARINGRDLTSSAGKAESEEYATAQENHFLEELGLPPRERLTDDAEANDFNDYWDNPPSPLPPGAKPPYDPDPTAPAGPRTLPQDIYDRAPERQPDGESGDGGGAEGNGDGSDTDQGVIDAIMGFIRDAIARFSPLVVDLDGDGIELTSLTGDNAAYWDHNLDGFAEASGWITGGDGFLVRDVNEDGIINNSSELFGDQTGYQNGFLALAALDSNVDGLITAEDADFSSLMVWIDDGDGFSDYDDLYSLSDLLITSINLAYTDVNDTNAGNSILQESTYVINGNTRDIVDAYFAVSHINSVYDQAYIINPDTLDLPTNRGYGVLADLHIAMSLDDEGTGNLLDLVSDLKDKSFADIFTADSTITDDVRDILYRWAGVDGLSGNERGDNIDSRELGFLEALSGEAFLQRGAFSNPYYWAGQDLQKAFHSAYNHFYAHLLTQSAGGELFAGDWSYNIAQDIFEGITGLDLTVLGNLETEATGLANTGEREVFWRNVVRMVEHSIGTGNLSGSDQTALEDAIYDSDNTLTLTGILDDIAWGGMPVTNWNGTSGADTYAGTSGNDDIAGSSGNDTLSGWLEDDIIDGGSGDDILTGGTGSDLITGDLGNDVYHYALGDGIDTYEERGNTASVDTADVISFGPGIDSGDITLVRAVNSTDLIINIDTGSQAGQIVIENQFNWAAGGGLIETILFSDTSTINLATRNYTLTGTDGADDLDGVRWGGGITDTIYGNGGNDNIYGYDGADTLYGGDGHDHIEGGDDNDTVYGDAGNDTLEGGSGNDHLYDGTGDDEASGGTGDDVYHYGGGHDTYIESSGTDSIMLASGIASASTVYYRIGNDMQIVFDTSNTITIPDFFSASGPKIETLDFYADADVNLTTVSTITQGDSGNNTLNGTASADYLYGNGGNDTVNGNSGNDFLYGGTGNDTITGGNGNDWLEGGAGNDDMQGGADADTYLFTSGLDTIYDISGTDELRFIEGWDASDLTFARNFGALNDMVITINGSNTITITDQFTSARQIETIRFYDNSTMTLTGLSVTTHGNSSANTISGVLYGGSLNDIIYGYGGNDTLNGGDGDDMLYGGDGDDTLNGNDGNDLLDGGAGNDTISGGAQNDIIVYSSGLDVVKDVHGGTDTLRMGSGIDVNAISFSNVSSYDTKITVTASVDEVTVENLRSGTTNYRIEFVEFADGFVTSLHDYASWVNGTSGNDLIAYTSADETILGKAGNDTITAGGGADDVHGGSGNDDISGDGGNDLLHGGDGDDILKGGDGLDTLYGGAGADAFVFQTASAFNNIDVIKDFDVANDVIDLTDVLGSYDPLTDLITDWVEMTTSGSDTVLKVDRDGTGGTYSLVQIATIQGITGLTNEEALVSGGQLLVA